MIRCRPAHFERWDMRNARAPSGVGTFMKQLLHRRKDDGDLTRGFFARHLKRDMSRPRSSPAAFARSRTSWVSRMIATLTVAIENQVGQRSRRG